MFVPSVIKLFHIMHYNKLSSVLRKRALLSDKEVSSLNLTGTCIGMNKIKRRRLEKLMLKSHENLFVGECVPFYFSPRSIMLYMIRMKNHPEIDYKEGQEPIIHLVADFKKVVEWAERNNKRWAFTTSNAGSYFFEDYSGINDLDKINWNAVNQKYWSDCREEKQAEFLLEKYFPWELVDYIAVISEKYGKIVNEILINGKAEHRPEVIIKPDWYY